MEGLAVIAIVIMLIVRTVKKHKESVRASQAKYRPQQPDAFAPQSEPIGERQPVQQRIELDRAPMTPRVEHRHVEQVHTQTDGFAGEGDAKRYNIREVSCETVGHDTSVYVPAKLPRMNCENLVSAVIMAEVLGKPKALRR